MSLSLSIVNDTSALLKCSFLYSNDIFVSPPLKENIHHINNVLIVRSLLLATVFVLLFLATSLKNIIKSINNLSEKFKGIIPGDLPIIGPLHMVAWYGNDFLKCLSSWADKPMYTTKIFGKKFAILNDPKLIKKLYGSNNPGHLSKSDFVYESIYSGNLLEGLIACPVHVWKPHRAIMAKAFSYKSLKNYLPLLNMHSEQLVSELMSGSSPDYSALATGKQKENSTLVELIHLYTLRIIAHIATGSNVINDADGLKFHKNITKFKELAVLRLVNPLLHISLISWIHPQSRAYRKSQVEADTFIENLVHRKRSKENISAIQKSNNCDEINENEYNSNEEFEFTSTLDILFDAGMSDREILAEITTFIIAGHETVANSLSFLMFNLALNSEHQSACREEVDEAFEELSSSCSSNTADMDSPKLPCRSMGLTMDSLNNMNYLERCLKENMRMFPAVAGLPRTLNAPLKFEEGATHDELGVGTEVIASVWAVHTDPSVWEAPETFNPDRFLPENSKERSIYSYLPFAAGPRNCIGWKLAMIEMKMVSAWILRHFEVCTSDKFSDVHILINITLEPKKPLNVYLKRRTK